MPIPKTQLSLKFRQPLSVRQKQFPLLALPSGVCLKDVDWGPANTKPLVSRGGVK